MRHISFLFIYLFINFGSLYNIICNGNEQNNSLKVETIFNNFLMSSELKGGGAYIVCKRGRQGDEFKEGVLTSGRTMSQARVDGEIKYQVVGSNPLQFQVVRLVCAEQRRGSAQSHAVILCNQSPFCVVRS
jgi:hypothetical protein